MKTNKNKMCGKKVSFRTKAAAEKIQVKYPNQRIYECPICFCWHLTTLENWEYLYIDRYEHEKLMNLLKNEVECAAKNRLNVKYKAIRHLNVQLHIENKRLRKLLHENNVKFTKK